MHPVFLCIQPGFLGLEHLEFTGDGVTFAILFKMGARLLKVKGGETGIALAFYIHHPLIMERTAMRTGFAPYAHFTDAAIFEGRCEIHRA